jgi:hypothetical protein
VSRCGDTARALYLELRAQGLEVLVEDNPDGGPLDFRIAIGGLRSRSEFYARSIMRRVLENEEGLVQLVLNLHDPDLDAIRREGSCR